jgi:hypothetical protein
MSELTLANNNFEGNLYTMPQNLFFVETANNPKLCGMVNPPPPLPPPHPPPHPGLSPTNSRFELNLTKTLSIIHRGGSNGREGPSYL